MEKQAEFTGTPKENLRALRILTIALSAGVIIFLLLAVLVNSWKGPVQEDKMIQATPVLLWIVLGVAAVCIVRARLIYSKKIKEIKAGGSPLRVKLDQYRPVLVLYMALCEGPALFSVIVFFLTGKYQILAVAGVMLVLMLLKLPSASNMIRELDLDWKEQEELN